MTAKEVPGPTGPPIKGTKLEQSVVRAAQAALALRQA